MPSDGGFNSPRLHHNLTELKAAEAAMCHVRMLELALKPVCGRFDFAHLKRIHERLLSDIYYFAGKPRDVDLAKDGSRFCQAIHKPLFLSRSFMCSRNRIAVGAATEVPILLVCPSPLSGLGFSLQF